jgi:hypothetical protein
MKTRPVANKPLQRVWKIRVHEVGGHLGSCFVLSEVLKPSINVDIVWLFKRSLLWSLSKDRESRSAGIHLGHDAAR